MSQSRQSFIDYDGFVEKFKPRKTTDDCYTPQQSAPQPTGGS